MFNAEATLLGQVANVKEDNMRMTPRIVVGMAHNSGPGDRERPAQAFFKPPSTVIGPGDPIVLPEGAGLVEPEAEIALVIGATCRNLTPETAAAALRGWTVGNDVTGRDLQKADPLWTRAKGYDTFTPLSDVVVPGLPDPDTDINLLADGQLVSSAKLSSLARGPIEILCYVSSFMTLEPGDVILTGAPGKALPLVPGMTVTIAAGGVELSNPVVAE